LRHSWLYRLLPVLLLLPGAVVTSDVLMATPAHATVTAACDPTEVSVVIHGRSEVVTFKLKNCTTATQRLIISGQRTAPAACTKSNRNFGDSPPLPLPAGQRATVTHTAPAPTCKGIYTVTGDTELRGTETVVDADIATYTV
jgi:hypothetical protein